MNNIMYLHDYTRFQNYATPPKIATLTCQFYVRRSRKLKLFNVLNFVDRYQCKLLVCFIKNSLNGFQDISVEIFAKVRFHIYLFTFVVAIYSSLPDIKLTFATKTIFGFIA